VCSRVFMLLQKSVGGVGLREARGAPFTRKDDERGRGSRASRVRARKRQAAMTRERTPRAGSLWKTSRDHAETSDDPCKCAGVAYRWKSPRIAARTSSSRRGLQNDLGSLGVVACAKAQQHTMGKRQGCQRHGSTEVRGRNTPRMNPTESAEANQAS